MTERSNENERRGTNRRLLLQALGGSAAVAALGNLTGIAESQVTAEQDDTGQETTTESEDHVHSTVENLQVFLVENFHWGFIPHKLVGDGSATVGEGGQGSVIRVSQGDVVVLVGWNAAVNHEYYEQLEERYEEYYAEKYGEETVEEFEESEEESPELNAHVMEVELDGTEVATEELVPENVETATSAIAFTAEERGEFTLRCDHYCGPGHGDMQGTVVVE